MLSETEGRWTDGGLTTHDAARQDERNSRTSWRILVVDGDPDVHTATLSALEGQTLFGRPLAFTHAFSDDEARLLLLRAHDLAMVILDVGAEQASSELDLVDFIRHSAGLRNTRIVLRTGQPGQVPDLETLLRYDINDYRTKSELTRNRLHVSLLAALRSGMLRLAGREADGVIINQTERDDPRVRYMHDRIKTAGGTGIKDVLTYMSNNPGSTLDAAIGAASAGAFTNAADVQAQFALNGAAFIGGFDLNNADTGAIGGADVDGGMVRDAKAALPNQGSRSGKDALQGFTETYENIASTSGAISTKVFQVGANANQTLETRVGAIGLGAMGLRNTLDVTTSAAQAIVSVDRALDYVNSQRAVIGAQSSRLESAIANLQIGSENLSASRSRIVDTDFAVETASLARQQILQQAGNAMVVQANQMPQGVLALLRT